MKLIERTSYMTRLEGLLGTPDIKIITGIRRSGKSKLLQSLHRHIQQMRPEANVVFIDFTRLAFEPLKDYHALHDYVEERRKDNAENYLLIDEVQMCKGFEMAVNSLHASEAYDIYLTGSNAFLLSADLATLFTGRHIEISVYPFSFKEYCTYFAPIHDTQQAFDRYVVEGGMAGAYPYASALDKETYIREVYETILTRDLTEKYKLADPHALTRIAEYMMDNVSNVTSPNNVAEGLTRNQSPTNHVTVRKYMRHLCNAFVFYEASRYDIRGKKYLESLSKFYLADTGIRHAILGRRNMDWGRCYENIVFLELCRRGYKSYVGKLYQKEVDFVAIRGNEKIYIQVSDNISDPATFERETEPLLKIHDAYPKLLIARTRHSEYDHQGVRIIDLVEWLLEDAPPQPFQNK